MNPGATRYIYVTFEMETIPENIINVADTEETKKNKIKVNIVEVSSYGTYHALDGLNSTNINSYNEHPIGTNAGLVDFKSMPENVDGIKETGVALKPYVPNVHEWDDSIAFVKFVEKQERTLSGNVWIENRNKEESNANIGNGIKEDGEAGYEGVRVQLYDNETNAIAKTHWEDTDGDGKLDWSDAPTLLTDANGDYGTFKGISPGDYYLLFTYPDGQTYKSTIFGGGAINTDTPDSNDGVNFDIDADSTNTDASNAYKFLSHARDKMGDESTAKTRKYVNNLLASVGEINEYKAGTEAQKVATNYETYIANNQGLDKEIAMEAITGHLIVGFETDPTKLNSNVGVEYTDITKLDSTTWEFTREFDLPKVNFGVVERPKSQLQLSKNVSYVRLVLGTGEILFDTSERSTNVSWVAAKKYVPQYDRNILQAIDIPAFRAIESNKGRVSMTADEEMLQGARLRIRYNIKVANIGEVDYDDNGFYYLGNAPADPDSSIVKTTIREVVDYAGYQGGSDDHVTRNNLKYEVEDNTGLDWVETNVANLMDPNGEKLADEIAYGVNEDGTAKTASDTNLRGASLYATILTNNMGETALKPQIVGSDYETAKDLTLTRKFNPNESEDDFTYNNLAEIISLQNGVGRRTQYSTVGNQDPENDLTKPDEATSEVDADHSEEVTLMGPYGQERYYGIIAIAASVIVIGAIVAAVIIVKRKKQNNNEE